LAEALEGAVFAIVAVEDGKHHVKRMLVAAVQFDENGAVFGKHWKRRTSLVRKGDFRRIVAVDDEIFVGVEFPDAFFIDADEEDFVFILVDGFEDVTGGLEGDFVFGGLAAACETDDCFGHGKDL
jgi:hypothetical protein